jgi:hypothetical protein
MIIHTYSKINSVLHNFRFGNAICKNQLKFDFRDVLPTAMRCVRIPAGYNRKIHGNPEMLFCSGAGKNNLKKLPESLTERFIRAACSPRGVGKS